MSSMMRGLFSTLAPAAKKSPVASIRQAVMDHFAEANIHYAPTDDPAVLCAPFVLGSGRLMLLCHCQEEAQRLIVQAVFPFQVPVARRAAMAEFMARVNYEIAVGAFEMDYNDGEVSFRAGVDVSGDRLTPALVRNVVGCSLMTSDHFFAGLAALAVGGLPPTMALDLVDEKAGRSQVLAAMMAGSGTGSDPGQWLN
jgi:hypothetical protein